MSLSPLESQLSFSNVTRIETIVDWDVVRRKFREQQVRTVVISETMTQETDAKEGDEKKKSLPRGSASIFFENELYSYHQAKSAVQK